MSFQLLISEGIDAGREFVFDQDAVVMGRQPDCDIVLSDTGVSRQHARIILEDRAYVIEDLGSANGTKVNGAVVKKKKLVHGDTFILGPVVIIFQGMDVVTEPRGLLPPVPMDEGDQSTRIVALDTVSRPEAGDGSTRVVSMDEIAKSRKSPSSSAIPALGDDEGPTRIGKLPTMANASDPVAHTTGELSAVDRARLRRGKSGLSADVAVRWAEKTPQQRLKVVALGTLVVLALVGTGFGVRAFASSGTATTAVEPTALTGNAIAESFGLGDGVQFVHADEKRFDFEVRSAGDALALFHFQSRDIAIGEVSVIVNGAEVGQVPPDALGAEERTHEIVVAPLRLKRNENNTIIFDNAKNPPGSETWRIFNVSVEIYPLPNLPREQLVQSAADALRKGDELYGRAGIGARNLYEAWRAYRDAWLRLFALDEKPEEFAAAERKLRESQSKLDASCSKLLLSVTQYLSQGKENEARLELDSVAKFFPANDQPCPRRAEDIRNSYGL